MRHTQTRVQPRPRSAAVVVGNKGPESRQHVRRGLVDVKFTHGRVSKAFLAPAAVSTPIPQAFASYSSDAEYQTLPDMFRQLSQKYPDQVCLRDPHRESVEDLTFRSLYNAMQEIAAAFGQLGLQAGGVVAQFSENSSRWLLVDQAIMMNGGINAVRGATSPEDELLAILQHAGACGVVMQDAEVARKLAPRIQELPSGQLKFAVVLWDSVGREVQAEWGDVPVYGFEEFRDMGRTALQRMQWSNPVPELKRDSVATLVYTSGTSGSPKAAALSHGNILYQVEQFPFFLPVQEGQVSLSILPPWHIYERTVCYYLLSRGATQIYTSIARFKNDLGKYQPNFLVCVPLVLDTLHSRIMATLSNLPSYKKGLAMFLLKSSLAHVRAKRLLAGVDIEFAFEKRLTMWRRWSATLTVIFTALVYRLAHLVVFKKVRKELGLQTAVVSGGGSLAHNLDDFFEAMELPVLNGWGMTETSPVMVCRRIDDEEDVARNVRGTVGHVIPGTKLRVVDQDTLKREREAGEEGVILVKGPGVMQGYWNNEEATSAAFQRDYFNTGDLGKVIPSGSPMAGQLVLTGRAKDTIVLMSGDNVSPQPIEDALACSSIIKHAMVVGQDKRTLGCLVSVDSVGLADYMAERGDSRPIASLSEQQLNNVVMAEVKRANATRRDGKSWEIITEVQAILESFDVASGTLTQTMKLKRRAVAEKYADKLNALLGRLR